MSRENGGIKRRRATRACNKCHASKTKCDGQQPICGRCEGYGFECTWPRRDGNSRRRIDDFGNANSNNSGSNNIGNGSSSVGNNSNNSNNNNNNDADAQSRQAREQDAMFQAISSYESIIRSLRPGLSDSGRAAVDLTLSCIRQRLPPDYALSLSQCDNMPPKSDVDSLTTPKEPPHTPTPSQYLGTTSDMHFFNKFRWMLHQDSAKPSADALVQACGQPSPVSPVAAEPPRRPLILPGREVADGYVNIYFSTIHVAYPFVCKPRFMLFYKKLWSETAEKEENPSMLALLYVMFAIGAFYTSFPLKDKQSPPCHSQYFDQALYFTSHVISESSYDSICALLAQTFYLLATCQSDRAWNILGLATRMGQTLGLHVENTDLYRTNHSTPTQREMRRRTWYSLYVMDRLMALQMGRSVSIREDDFNVELPIEVDDGHFDFQSPDEIKPDAGPSFMNYFIHVIRFSQIIGHVSDQIYRPTQAETFTDDMSSCAALLDNELLTWKANLPRHLRFDLGHTFEKGNTFKRQRNMLAMKFHHLRSLVHRPYLCLSWLQHSDETWQELSQKARANAQRAEAICISEAQETAHLLHNVVDERSLMQDFPFWQMISCLICASSVLLVASACIRKDRIAEELQAQALDEDAETCLKVFDALSESSDVARQAMGMMNELKKLRTASSKRSSFNLSPSLSGGKSADNCSTASVPISENTSGYFDVVMPDAGCPPKDTMNWLSWSSEISDSMNWSAQFLLHPRNESVAVLNQLPTPMENDHEDVARRMER